MAGDEITVDIKSLVNLKPEYIQGLNPHALDKYVSFQNEVREILLKGQFKEVCDYQLYLSQEEMSKMNTRAIEIGDWLTKCRKDSGEVSLLLYVYNPFIGNAMVDFNSFLKSAVDRRLEQLKQVATKQEEKARQEAEKKKRLAALEEVNPPARRCQETAKRE